MDNVRPRIMPNPPLNGEAGAVAPRREANRLEDLFVGTYFGSEKKYYKATDVEINAKRRVHEVFLQNKDVLGHHLRHEGKLSEDDSDRFRVTINYSHNVCHWWLEGDKQTQQVALDILYKDDEVSRKVKKDCYGRCRRMYNILDEGNHLPLNCKIKDQVIGFDSADKKHLLRCLSSDERALLPATDWDFLGVNLEEMLKIDMDNPSDEDRRIFYEALMGLYARFAFKKYLTKELPKVLDAFQEQIDASAEGEEKQKLVEEKKQFEHLTKNLQDVDMFAISFFFVCDVILRSADLSEAEKAARIEKECKDYLLSKNKTSVRRKQKPLSEGQNSYANSVAAFAFKNTEDRDTFLGDKQGHFGIEQELFMKGSEAIVDNTFLNIMFNGIQRDGIKDIVEQSLADLYNNKLDVMEDKIFSHKGNLSPILEDVRARLRMMESE